jgi:hypothetical protein
VLQIVFAPTAPPLALRRILAAMVGSSKWGAIVYSDSDSDDVLVSSDSDQPKSPELFSLINNPLVLLAVVLLMCCLHPCCVVSAPHCCCC